MNLTDKVMLARVKQHLVQFAQKICKLSYEKKAFDYLSANGLCWGNIWPLIFLQGITYDKYIEGCFSERISGKAI